MFKWDDSFIMGEDRENLESINVEFNYIFARQRLDIGLNTQIKVSPMLKDDTPVYTQNLPVSLTLCCIGIAASTAEQLIKNIRPVLRCIRNAGW